MEFLFADNNMPFSIALMLMLIIAVMEGALTLIGLGMSQALDSLLPDIDADMDSSGSSGGALSNLLGWIRFGQVPMLILLVVFLAAFSLIGLALQLALDNALGFTLPAIIAAPLAFMGSLPVLRTSTGILAKVVFKDETESISSNSFVGHIAVITVGEARLGSAAEARFSDRFGTSHYVMVEPIDDNIFKQGDKVLLVEERGAIFSVIAPTNPNLK